MVRQGFKAVALAVGGDFWIVDARGIDLHDQQIAHQTCEFAADDSQVESCFDDLAGFVEHTGGVFAGDDFGDVELRVAADEAEHRADVCGGDGVARERENLIERRQRVAHAAFGGAGD